MSEQQPQSNPRGRWVAIVTGALSILIGVLYLGLITVLDARGPLQPPPPEALGVVATAGPADAAEAPPHGAGPPPENRATPPPSG